MGWLARLFGASGRNDKPVASEPYDEAIPRWDGSTVDWSAVGVPADRVMMAEQIAASADFGIDPPTEPATFTWDVALFDDVRGIVGDAAIEALEGWLPTLDGIDTAVWADREYFMVAGPISRHDLAVAVIVRLVCTGDPDYWTVQPDGTLLGPTDT